MKNVLLITGLAVLSTSAFASKARMEALGQGDTSFYATDTRSVFLNPASLNDVKNYIVTEWGASQQGDSATAPRAEGGFFRENGTFAYGLYLGNNGAGRTASTAFLDHTNALDLFLAGDMGMKWGAKLHYADSKDETGTFTKKNSAFGIGLGLGRGDVEGYVNFDLSDKSTGANVAGDEWKRKPGMQIGGSYKWSGISFFADYASTNEDVTKGTSGITTATFSNWEGVGASTFSGTTLTHKTTALTVGAAKIHEVNPTSRFVSDGRYVSMTNEVSGATANNGKEKLNAFAATFALETDATSWLTLRGSVVEYVLVNSFTNFAGKKASVANSAGVNAGATLNFGKLKVDGLVGTTAASTAARTVGSKEGVLATDNLMSRVAVTYNF